MNVLSKLKTDGTFHQRAPLERLHGKRILYSYDLKALRTLYQPSFLINAGTQFFRELGVTSLLVSYRLRGASYRVSSGYQRPGDGNDTGCCSIRLVAYGRILSSCGRGSRLL
ncbi:hypothetical protein IEQ34_026012 [Dendrobium chrysotoxum]|uniref:Uncharacterized protein n=1 Tax=Dendrobium chrysotoxum TaxID=161865 RepID=A0AAV7FNN8_DENCH|nr:hypothetical protein IEQ34_026012 [Dendrobium chrysotoxum]